MGWGFHTLAPHPIVMNKELAKRWKLLGVEFPPDTKQGRPRKTLPKEAFELSERLGISEVCRQLGVARTTFYRHMEWQKSKQ